MTTPHASLIKAEQEALLLFEEVVTQGLIAPGKTEHQLNEEIFHLAESKLGIKKYWHKRIVRAGANTLLPYHENPQVLTLQEDDILFLDFGPIFDEWEADLGRTYVIGNDAHKLRLQRDTEKIWLETKAWFDQQQRVTGAELFAYTVQLTEQLGWTFGGEIAGHIVGHFPHEKLGEGIKTNYVHPDNHQDMRKPNAMGEERFWILEVHIVDPALRIGGFFEQLLN